MKLTIAVIVLSASLVVNSYEHTRNDISSRTYNSETVYVFENTCFRYEYREYYVPDKSIAPGYVRSYKEKVSVPCYRNCHLSNHNHYEVKPKTSYVSHKHSKKCTGRTTLGGLIVDGIAAAQSKKDSYGWAIIPFGAVLGAGIGKAECN